MVSAFIDTDFQGRVLLKKQTVRIWVARQGFSRKKHSVIREKSPKESQGNVTLNLHLNEELVRKARNHRANLSRITEQALSSILDYLRLQIGPKALNFLLNVLVQRKR